MTRWNGEDRLESVAAFARRRTLSDDGFDTLFPRELRHLSSVHWTPVAAAVRAVHWLAPAPAMRLLDVGCGPGKMCAIGALWTNSAWYGVEQHRSLASAASELARTLGLSKRVCIVHGDVLSLSWASFDGFYFYNPFEIPVLGDTDDGDPELAHDGLLAAIQERLESLRNDTRVVTYNGLGAELPPSYELARSEVIEQRVLELWIRTGGRSRREAAAR